MRVFGRAAQLYHWSREQYPDSVIQWLRSDWRGDERVVDLGTGTGQLASQVRPYVGAMTAVDSDLAMLSVGRTAYGASEPYPISWVAGTVAALPCLDSVFDVALIGNAYHWMNGKEALRELRRVLVEGAGLYLITRNAIFDGGEVWKRRIVECSELAAYSVPRDALSALADRSMLHKSVEAMGAFVIDDQRKMAGTVTRTVQQYTKFLLTTSTFCHMIDHAQRPAFESLVAELLLSEQVSGVLEERIEYLCTKAVATST